MQDWVIAVVGALVSAIAPTTSFVLGRSKARLEKASQDHSLALAKSQHEHAITTAYLDRALNQEVPLAIRQQLLRFLSTRGTGDDKMRTWAASELKLVDSVVEGLDKEIVSAEKKLNEARDPEELARARAALQLAVSRKRSAVEPVRLPPPTPAALRAGYYTGGRDRGELRGIDLQGQDLHKAWITYADMTSANLRACQAEGAIFQGSDLRAADLSEGQFSGVSFHGCDLRAANLAEADFTGANFTQARLQGANLKGATLSKATMRATFDGNTKWPDGFDPEGAGAVRVDEQSSESKKHPE